MAEGIAFDGNALWVAESGQRSIVQLARKGSILRRATVGRLPVGMASVGDGKVYALVQTDQIVWEQPSTGNGRKLATLSECPQALAANPQALWVLTWPDCSSQNSRAVKIDPATGRQSQTEPLGEWGQAIATGFGKVWVAHARGPGISAIDPQTMRVAKAPLRDASLWALATSAGSVIAGGRIGADGQGLLVAIDPANLQERGRLLLGELIITLAVDEESIVAIGEKGTVWVVSAADFKLRGTVSLGVGAFRPSSALIRDGALLIVAQEYKGENGAVFTLTNWR